MRVGKVIIQNLLCRERMRMGNVYVQNPCFRDRSSLYPDMPEWHWEILERKEDSGQLTHDRHQVVMTRSWG